MDPNLFAQIWPFLAIAGFALATAMLSILAAHQRYAIHLHDTIRSSRIKRYEYLAALAEEEAAAAEALEA